MYTLYEFHSLTVQSDSLLAESLTCVVVVAVVVVMLHFSPVLLRLTLSIFRRVRFVLFCSYVYLNT